MSSESCMSGEFSPAQQAVLGFLAAGASKSDAASAANVHRDTVHHWEHTIPGFHHAVLPAETDYRHCLAGQLRRIAVEALNQL